jgi:MIP family channel proteins
MNVRALAAELVGTYILVAVGSFGIASAAVSTISSQSGESFSSFVMLIVPFAFGLALMAGIAVAGHVSGAHFNPAVTLAMLFDGRIDWLSAIFYVVAQVIGAVLASLTVLVVLTKDFVNATVNHAGPLANDPSAAQLHAFVVEVVLTAIFVLVILTVTRKAPTQAAFVIGLTLAAIHLAAVPLSGASVNPARSLAPAVVSGDYEGLWIYLTAPFLGAIIGWAISRFLTPPEDDLIVEEEIEEPVDLFEDEAASA